LPGRVPLVRGGVMFEDWSVDLDQADDESPAQTPVSRDAKLLPVDWRLFDVLAAHRGRAGIYPAVPRLVDALKVSDSTVHRSLRRLAAAGLVERIPVFERDDDPEWQRRGHRTRHAKRQTSNSYRRAPVSRGLGKPQLRPRCHQNP
jgi:DNA-binding transcriptional ArsR family regulator